MSSREPDSDLITAVEKCFTVAARKQNLNCTTEALHLIFDGGFKSNLTRWKKGGRSVTLPPHIKFTEQLIGIFEGNKSAARVLPEHENMWLRFARFLQNYEDRNKICCLLKAFALHLEKLRPTTTGQTTRREDYLFPKHIDKIISLVKQSKEILIECDCVDYGSFRDFKRHRYLIEALCKKGNFVKLLIVPTLESMSRANRFHWRDIARQNPDTFLHYVRLLLSNLQKQKYRQFFQKEFYTVQVKFDNADWSDDEEAFNLLYELQRRYQDLVLFQLFSHSVQIKFLSRDHKKLKNAKPSKITGTVDELPEYPTFLWISDKQKAIIVSISTGDDAVAKEECDPIEIARLRKNYMKAYNFSQSRTVRLSDLRYRSLSPPPLLKKKIRGKRTVHN